MQLTKRREAIRKKAVYAWCRNTSIVKRDIRRVKTVRNRDGAVQHQYLVGFGWKILLLLLYNSNEAAKTTSRFTFPQPLPREQYSLKTHLCTLFGDEKLRPAAVHPGIPRTKKSLYTGICSSLVGAIQSQRSSLLRHHATHVNPS